jgi:methyl coenzyme M reductase subunit D
MAELRNGGRTVVDGGQRARRCSARWKGLAAGAQRRHASRDVMQVGGREFRATTREGPFVVVVSDHSRLDISVKL